MNAFVLDCSVTMAWCFEDECDAYADAVLAGLAERSALVPSIWGLEVVNVLLVAERRRRIKTSESSRFLSLLAALSIDVDPEAVDLTLAGLLARGRELRLSAYDASYLDLAVRRGVPLATRDRALRAACKKTGVEVLRP